MAIMQQSTRMSVNTLLPVETIVEVKYSHLVQAYGLIAKPDKLGQ